MVSQILMNAIDSLYKQSLIGKIIILSLHTHWFNFRCVTLSLVLAYFGQFYPI